MPNYHSWQKAGGAIVMDADATAALWSGFVLPTSCLDWLIYRTVLKKLKPMERPAEHCLEIARALTYLHSIADPPIIHRNVKTGHSGAWPEYQITRNLIAKSEVYTFEVVLMVLLMGLNSWWEVYG
ncbi:hypothetical protein AAG906_007624 [Vitis piasezkii]